MEDKILDYGDVLLRRQDALLLLGNNWLNDQVQGCLLIYAWITLSMRKLLRIGAGLSTYCRAACDTATPPSSLARTSRPAPAFAGHWVLL